ncbi:hypothetical protein RGQ29_000710 [Quercus rubra]|uniref:non-specific serine/threonine protein kinase n=1 Tax=Quercus rubra TaxID=3512 RepID=A0AAN7G705_QUERU|nr:hypothetical protein RGQ29_000710 [Quercus rubra]
MYIFPSFFNGDWAYITSFSANLNLDGTTRIHPNGLLQLTNNSEKQLGYAFYQLPLKFNTSSGGHGIAFTISPLWKFTNVVASNYLGLLNASNNGLSTNHLLAIELDTIEGQEFQDIDKNHVGIDVNSLKSLESATATYFSDQERKNISLELETEKLLKVTLAPTSILKPNRPLLSTHINMSQILLESMFVGFSAATGTVTSDHYILGWSFNKSGQAQSLDISKLPQPPRQRKSDKRGQIIMILIIAVVVVLILVTGAIFILRRKKYAEILEDWENKYGPHRFSYKNLYKATKGFSNKELLGEGGFGKVYKGTLRSSNIQIAVKKVSHNSKQGMKEFVAEIISMGRLRHRNLVQLLGYCCQKGELLLVYDYMPNGSLDKFLYGNEKPKLNWLQRFQILKGVASGLLYLHEKLGDFGLARLCDHSANPQTTNVVGTVGYLAPELTRTGRATTCTDVFAFRAFVLEVACGRKPIEPQRQPEEVILVDWFFEWRKGAILDASDHRLEPARPSIKQVMQFLDGNDDLQELPHDNACFGNFTRVEESEILLSIPRSFGKYLSPSPSTDSILKCGR